MINKLPNLNRSYELFDEIYNENVEFQIQKNIFDKPIILYGAGNLGKMAKEYFDKLGITILCIVDKNAATLHDKYWKNISILEPNKIPIDIRKTHTIINCIVTSPQYEVENILNEMGFCNIIPFYDITLLYQNKHPLNNGWITGKLNKNDRKSVRYVLKNLQDDISRAHYLQFIAWHTLREEWIFEDAKILNNRYFIPEILSILNEEEIFVDIGAHHGNVTKQFINITNHKFDSIYVIEPDYENIVSLIYNIDNSEINHNIHLIPKALGRDKETKKFYSGLGYTSQFSNIGNQNIDVEKLDNLNIKPTFIKIHTEGCEDEIIKGGINIIKNNRPIIVVTAYHNKKGLWKLPILLMKSLKNYIFYYRLHSWFGTGAVIYAIPGNRI